MPSALGRKNWLFSASPLGGKQNTFFSHHRNRQRKLFEAFQILRFIPREIKKASTEEDRQAQLSEYLDRNRIF
jgi:hypothetical protein